MLFLDEALSEQNWLSRPPVVLFVERDGLWHLLIKILHVPTGRGHRRGCLREDTMAEISGWIAFATAVEFVRRAPVSCSHIRVFAGSTTPLGLHYATEACPAIQDDKMRRSLATGTPSVGSSASDFSKPRDHENKLPQEDSVSAPSIGPRIPVLSALHQPLTAASDVSFCLLPSGPTYTDY